MEKSNTLKKIKVELMTMGEAFDRHLLKCDYRMFECEKDKAGYFFECENGYQFWLPKEEFEKRL